MTNTITVLGLGAGNLDQMPYGIYKMLTAKGRCFTRTIDHPVIDELKNDGVEFISFDHVYEKHDDFAAVYEEISDFLIEQAKKADVLYTVPGHPMVAEMTVQLLIEKTTEKGIRLNIEGGQSFLDDLFTAVKLDPIDGFQLLDGTALKREDIRMTQALIIGQVYDAFIASEVKLTLMELYPDDYQVAIVTAAGSDKESIKWIPLYELDRGVSISNLTSVYVPAVKKDKLLYKNFDFLRHVIDVLRGPAGCPWDREQTHESLKKYAIEEVYELIDAINSDDPDEIIAELGDVLLQVMLHARIGEDEGMFSIDDVIESVNEKMIRRHPHVFGNVQLDSAEEVVSNWEMIKEQERSGQERSILDGIEQSMPQLMIAKELQKRAAKVGFDWKEVEPIFEKVFEEIEEFREEAAKGNELAMQQEFGDVLFALVNAARFYRLSPEEALHRTNRKFTNRFRYIEDRLAEEHKQFEDCSLEELDKLWEEAKFKGL
ncbi:MAG: nucleoside triphosphate pyrophosphohydrolase [Bacillus sp. (in: firmicutes)]